MCRVSVIVPVYQVEAYLAKCLDSILAQTFTDFELILEAYQHRGYAKGARGIYMHLLHKKPAVVMNVKKIRRLMAKYGLFCPIRNANPYRRMAKALKTSNVAENLVNREFEAYGPRMILLTDISYIPYNGTVICP